MRPRRIMAILGKDLRDAWRDGRIVILLLMPIAIALIPSLGGDDELPTTNVAIVEQDGGAVAGALRRTARDSSLIDITRVPDAAAARELVAGEAVDLAIVVEALSPARAPRAQVLVSDGASPGAQAVVALVPDALTRAAGRPPAARIRITPVARADAQPGGLIEPQALTIVLSIILLATFVAMMVVPIQTGEEIETGTLGALRLAATGPEILAAKALAGYAYGAGGVVLTVLLTGLDVHDPLLFYGAAGALIVSLVGFGLLMGLVVPNTNAINTYGGFCLFPLLGAAVAVFFVDSGIFATILDLLPFSQAAKLLADGASSPPPFGAGAASWAVIAAWALLGYLVLARIASRREI